MKVILLFGFSDAGKTTCIEQLCQLLVRKGYKIGVLKHIHHPKFTIDTPGKDTWRFAQSGASVIVSLAQSEIAIIKKEKTSRISLEKIIGVFKEEGIDYLFVEGLHSRFQKWNSKQRRMETCHVFCARNKFEAQELLFRHPKSAAICITGKIARLKTEPAIRGIPIIRDVRTIARLITNA